MLWLAVFSQVKEQREEEEEEENIMKEDGDVGKVEGVKVLPLLSRK